MKKFLLLILSVASIFTSASVNAQSFTLKNGDSVFVMVADDGTANGDNSIINTSPFPLTITWHVLDNNLPPSWIAGGGLGICDNNLCYFNNSNNSLLNGSFTTSPISTNPDSPATFHLQSNFSNATTGTNLTGTYYITAQLVGGGETKNVTFIIGKWPTSVSTVSKPSNNVVVYPNPARDQINVLYQPAAGVKTIAVYNVIGKIMSIYKVTSNTSAMLDLNNIPTGIYFLRLMDGQGQVVGSSKFTRQ